MSARVLVVAPLYHTERGGLGRQAVLLTERLAALGVRPRVATRFMTGLPDRAWDPHVAIDRIRVGRAGVHNYERPNATNFLTSLLFSLGLILLIIRRRREFDVAHFHGASLPLLVARPVLHLLGKRVVAKVAATNQGVEAGDVRRRYGPIGRLLARQFAKVDRYVATTDEIARVLEGDGVPRDRIARIPNFIETTAFHPPTAEARAKARAELGLDGRTVVVASGRLSERKGSFVLLEAFAKAATKAASVRPLLVFLGDGDERAALEERARALGVDVRFDGFVSDVERRLGASDVLVLASVIEGFPNALLEAMACGLACVASRIGGSEAAIEDGRTGLLVPARDVDALAAALERVLLDPDLRARLGRDAAERVARDLALEKIAPRYLELYAGLAPRRSRCLARCAALIVSIVLALVAAEVSLRVAVRESPWLEGRPLSHVAFQEIFDFPDRVAERADSKYVVDPAIGYHFKPRLDQAEPFPEAPGGSYRLLTNALGFRDVERGPKPAGTQRVLALGDSMTFGVGVEREQTWPAKLEPLLGRVEVVAAAVPGWGQQEEVAFLRDPRARALAPDVVVLEMCVSNDVLEDLRYREEGGRLVADPRVRGDLERHWLLVNPLADRSRLYRLLMWRAGRHALRYAAMKDEARLARVAGLVHDADVASRALGAKLVVLVAPTLAQVEGGLTERVLGTRAINASFAASATAAGAPVVEPLDSLRAAQGSGHQVYFARDMHWTPEGHQVVAEALAPVVKNALGR